MKITIMRNACAHNLKALLTVSFCVHILCPQKEPFEGFCASGKVNIYWREMIFSSFPPEGDPEVMVLPNFRLVDHNLCRRLSSLRWNFCWSGFSVKTNEGSWPAGCRLMSQQADRIRNAHIFVELPKLPGKTNCGKYFISPTCVCIKVNYPPSWQPPFYTKIQVSSLVTHVLPWKCLGNKILGKREPELRSHALASCPLRRPTLGSLGWSCRQTRSAAGGIQTITWTNENPPLENVGILENTSIHLAPNLPAGSHDWRGRLGVRPDHESQSQRYFCRSLLCPSTQLSLVVVSCGLVGLLLHQPCLAWLFDTNYSGNCFPKFSAWTSETARSPQKRAIIVRGQLSKKTRPNFLENGPITFQHTLTTQAF